MISYWHAGMSGKVGSTFQNFLEMSTLHLSPRIARTRRSLILKEYRIKGLSSYWNVIHPEVHSHPNELVSVGVVDRIIGHFATAPCICSYTGGYAP